MQLALANAQSGLTALEHGEHSIPGAFKEHTRSGNLR